MAGGGLNAVLLGSRVCVPKSCVRTLSEMSDCLQMGLGLGTFLKPESHGFNPYLPSQGV